MTSEENFVFEGAWTAEEIGELEQKMNIPLRQPRTYTGRGWLCTCYDLRGGEKVFIANDMGTSRVLAKKSVSGLAEAISRYL